MTQTQTADRVLDDELRLTHLKQLEAESIHIMREVVAQFENPVMMYSIGKDSSVMLHLALKAFHPAPLPFPLLHVNTTWKFADMITFRDRIAAELGVELISWTNQEGLDAGINPFDHGSKNYTDIMKTQALKQALEAGGYDAAFGGARRDEEKSRAKERVFSFRDKFHRWDPKNQRPELWDQYNGRVSKGESIRVFPLEQLDRARHLAVHPARGHRDRPAVLLGRAARRRARRRDDHDRRRPVPVRARRRTRDAVHPVPYPGVLSLVGCGRIDCGDVARDHPGDVVGHTLGA